jgi:hypothetical protein
MVGKKAKAWNSGRCTCGTEAAAAAVTLTSAKAGGFVEEIWRAAADDDVVRKGPTGAREVMEGTDAF